MHGGDLEALSYQVIQYGLPLIFYPTRCWNCELVWKLTIVILTQDLHKIWNSVSHEFAMRRNCIQELDELLVKYEIERAAMVEYQNGVLILIEY